MRGWVVAAVLLAAAARSPRGAHAEQPVAGPSHPDPATVERARAHHAAGLRHYDRAEYDDAIREFKAAHDLAPAAGLLFNIAHAYRLKGPRSCPEAIHAYKAYLRNAAGDDQSLPIAEQHVAQLEECARAERERRAEAQRLAAAPARSPPATPAEVPSRRRLWSAIVFAAGAATAALGVGLYVSAAGEYGRLEDSCAAGDCPPGRWEEYRTRETWGVGLVGAGGVVAVGAAIVWLLPVERRQVQVVPTGSGAAISGRF